VRTKTLSSTEAKPPRGRRTSLALLFSAAVAVSTLGCASTGPFVWFNDLPRPEWGDSAGEYVIGIGDSLKISVYEQDALTMTAKIRSDGRIAMPFIGEVIAVGKHPSQLATEIEGRLKQFIVTPRVTINVESQEPIKVTLLGEAAHIGVLTLESPGGLLQALAQAGGFSDFADKSKIFVLRRTPEFRRIRFTYDALIQNSGGAATFVLRTGDVIVVE
jgi:polysaccharide export outer membrane protein